MSDIKRIRNIKVEANADEVFNENDLIDLLNKMQPEKMSPRVEPAVMYIDGVEYVGGKAIREAMRARGWLRGEGE